MDTTRMRAGDRLPALLLPALDGGPAVPLRTHGRYATVMVTVHADCRSCEHYLEELTSAHDDVREWDGRVIAVVTDGDAAPPRLQHTLHGPLRIARDREHRLRAAGVPTPAVLIADQWGELFVVEDAREEHTFLSAAEVVAWLRYLAMQCPECQGEIL